MLYIIFTLQLSPLLPPRHILIIAVKFKNHYSYLESYQKMDPSLHTLLAGPILWRAEPKQVSIWIACSIPVIIRAEIFRVADLEPISVNQNKNNNEQAKPIGLGSATCIRFGEHLYIGLVTAKPIPQAETSRE